MNDEQLQDLWNQFFEKFEEKYDKKTLKNHDSEKKVVSSLDFFENVYFQLPLGKYFYT